MNTLHEDAASAAWQKAKGALRDRLGAARTLSWVDDISIDKVDRPRGRVAILARSQTAVRQAREFQAPLESALAVALGLPRISVRLRRPRAVRPVEKRLDREPAAPRALRAPLDRPQEFQRSPQNAVGEVLGARGVARTSPYETDSGDAYAIPSVQLETGIPDERRTLASFIVGPSNAIAHGFAREVAEHPGGFANPLLLHGDGGTGKSHLVHAIANGYARRFPHRRVVLASSERFAAQFTLAVRAGEGARFRGLYREADLLVLDDIQHLAGKTETEKELLHTIDELVARGRQVVLASTFGPKRLPKVDPALEGRLLQGVVVELRSPDQATREELVRAQLALFKLELEPHTVRLLAQRFERTDQLLGAIKRIDAHARLLDRRLSPQEIEAAVGEVLRAKDESPTPAAIAAFVGQALDLDPEAIKGTSRKPSVVKARQLAMALARRLTLLTLREVGAHFGDRSCACVHFAQRKVKLLRDRDKKVQATYDEAIRRFARKP